MNIFKRQLSSAVLLSLTLMVGGCEKPADLGRMQEETLALVKQHGKDVDLLQRRADALMARGRNVGSDAPGISDAGRILSEARSGIDQLRALVSSAPTTIGNAARTNNSDEVQRVSDDLVAKLKTGEVAARSNLAAVDNWLMSVENRPTTAAAPATPGNESPNPPVPPAPAAPETGSGSGAGSAAGSAPGSATGSGAATPK
ncbi:MAG: hypothetical protein H0T46_13325 [Deltaproteobacteria bacterium]|nr:hypothetical protein [Deltaproteobacteria bacterium]